MPTAERARDAALTAVLAGVVVAVAPTPVSPPAVAVGVLGTLLVEWSLSRRAATVHRVWARWRVRVTAFVGAFLAATLLSTVLGPAVWTAVVAGCATYLLVLAGAELRARR